MRFWATRRACLASGREYDRAGVATNFANDFPIAAEEPTFYKLLRDAGWWVMTAGKDDLTKATQPGANGTFHQEALGFSDAERLSGKMDVLTGGPHEPYGIMLNQSTVAMQDGAMVNAYDAHRACLTGHGATASLCDSSSYPPKLYEDNWTAKKALQLLGRKPFDAPFFLEVSFPGPHPPFTVTTPMRDVVGGRVFPEPVDNPSGSADVCPSGATEPYTGKQCAYAAEIENLDRLVGLILDELANQSARRGSDILVCFASDHGTMLYDHGDEGKTMPWQPSVSVPLVCAGPGVGRNRTVSVPVATMDLAGTFLDLAGVPRHAGMSTQSLRPLLEAGDAGAAAYRPFVSSGLQSTPFHPVGGGSGGSHPSVQGARRAAGAGGVDAAAQHGASHYSWRMVVKRMGDGRQLKYVCCKGRCNGSPSTAPGPDNDGFTRILYDTLADPNDMDPLHDPAAKAELQALLPVGFCPAPP